SANSALYVCQLTFCKTILWVVLTGESSSELKVLAIDAVIVVKMRLAVGHATGLSVGHAGRVRTNP
ncbi:MAG: hypothetical protein F6K55_10110, partial [Moorea sp. SIO4A3]|nr:hypothetical protein [Moorena sp. SIO4A3]